MAYIFNQNTETNNDTLENDETYTELPLGIEWVPKLDSITKQLLRQDKINHVQISIPATWSRDALNSLTEVKKICAHSMHLNTLGENDWSRLKKAAKVIREINPIAVVEHYTVFTDTRRKKHAFSFQSNSSHKKILEKGVENIKKWQDLLGCNVTIENIPLSEDVTKYFELFRETSAKAQIRVSLDLPHIIISANTIGMNYKEINEFLREENPWQVHIGGLKVSDTLIDDNHRNIHAGLFKLIKSSAIKPELITLEQDTRISSASLRKIITNFESLSENSKLPDLNRHRKTRTSEEFSNDLSLERSKLLNIIEFDRTPLLTIKNSLNASIFEDAYPFIYPLSSLKKSVKKMNLGDAVEVLSNCLMKMKYFNTWYGKWCIDFFLEINDDKTVSCIDFQNEIEIEGIPKTATKMLTLEGLDFDRLNIFIRESIKMKGGANE